MLTYRGQGAHLQGPGFSLTGARVLTCVFFKMSDSDMDEGLLLNFLGGSGRGDPREVLLSTRSV